MIVVADDPLIMIDTLPVTPGSSVVDTNTYVAVARFLTKDNE